MFFVNSVCRGTVWESSVPRHSSWEWSMLPRSYCAHTVIVFLCLTWQIVWQGGVGVLSGVPHSIRMLDIVYAHPSSLRDSPYNLSCYPHVSVQSVQRKTNNGLGSMERESSMQAGEWDRKCRPAPLRLFNCASLIQTVTSTSRCICKCLSVLRGSLYPNGTDRSTTCSAWSGGKKGVGTLLHWQIIMKFEIYTVKNKTVAVTTTMCCYLLTT